MPGAGIEVFAVGEVRLPVLPPGRQPGGRGRPGADDGRQAPRSPRRSSSPCSGPSGRSSRRFVAWRVATRRRQVRQGYKRSETADALDLRDPATRARSSRSPRPTIEEQREAGHADARGLAAAMTPTQRRDLMRFLLELGHDRAAWTPKSLAESTPRREFAFDRAPLDPSDWPTVATPGQPRPRLRLLREGGRVLPQAVAPAASCCPRFPASTAASSATGATRTRTIWNDDRWNRPIWARCCAASSGRGRSTVPKGVCVRLGDNGEMAACFNPETLCYEALWQGGFVKFSDVRHGFLDGLTRPASCCPGPRARSRRSRSSITASIARASGSSSPIASATSRCSMLRGSKDGKFDADWSLPRRSIRCAHADSRRAGPVAAGVQDQGRARHAAGPMRSTRSSRRSRTRGTPCCSSAITTSCPTARRCSARCRATSGASTGLDDELKDVRWRRFASGLHQPLGLVVADGSDLRPRPRPDHAAARPERRRRGRFLRMRLERHTSRRPAGHDFICGLARDKAGRFYTARASRGCSGSRPTARRSKSSPPASATRTAWACCPMARSPCPARRRMDAGVDDLRGRTGRLKPAAATLRLSAARKTASRPSLPLVYLPRGLDN